LPSSTKLFKRTKFAEENAVSALEKNALSKTNTINIPHNKGLSKVNNVCLGKSIGSKNYLSNGASLESVVVLIDL
jgi:hypothetical protein